MITAEIFFSMISKFRQIFFSNSLASDAMINSYKIFFQKLYKNYKTRNFPSSLLESSTKVIDFIENRKISFILFHQVKSKQVQILEKLTGLRLSIRSISLYFTYDKNRNLSSLHWKNCVFFCGESFKFISRESLGNLVINHMESEERFTDFGPCYRYKERVHRYPSLPADRIPCFLISKYSPSSTRE